MTKASRQPAILNVAGLLAMGAGLLLTASLLAPPGEPGTNGLHRVTRNEKEMLMYGAGDTFYLTSTRSVIAAAAVFLLAGTALAISGWRRSSRPSGHS